MATCQHCHIEVAKSLSHCPVCGGFIQKVSANEKEMIYPTADYQHIEKQTANHLHAYFAFPLLLALFMTLMIDLALIANELGTTFMMTFIVFYAWIIIYKTILNRQGIGYIILWQVFGISLGTIMIAFVALGTFNAWPLQYVVPIILSLSNVLFFILTTVQRKTEVILFQMFVSALLGLVQFSMIYWLLPDTVVAPSLIAGVTSLLSLFALFTYLRKKFLAYLQRWLHI